MMRWRYRVLCACMCVCVYMWKAGGWGPRLHRKQPPLDDETGALFVYMLGSGGEVRVALEETHKLTRSSLPGLTCGRCWKVNGHLSSLCSVVTASQTCTSQIWLLRSEGLLSQWDLVGFVCPEIKCSLFVKVSNLSDVFFPCLEAGT